MRRRSLLTLAAVKLFGQSEESFVRVSQRDKRYFELSDGQPYIPIGLNLIAPPGEDAGLQTMERWLGRLAANRGNYIRLWLSSPFWDVEHERSGVYDTVKAERIDRVLGLCRKQGIRAKLTMEHFRAVANGRQPWAQKSLHHLSNGGPAGSMAEFFASDRSREQFRRKIRWYAERYGNMSTVFAWELWNEIDAVEGPADWMDWTRVMLDELRRAFPKNMTLQSLGSYDREYKRTMYRDFCRLANNDAAQVHRYLDLGAQLAVCKGPMDLLAADAVRDLLSFQCGKPVLLAESGAVEPNHSGPFLLYAADKQGMLLHDVLFAPFFSGAAGPGQIWHWDVYVDKNDLWWQFGRFAEAVKDIDPPAEAFESSVATQGRLRVYTLRGKRTVLAWCRDSANTWQTELRDGRPPERLRGQTLDLPGFASGRAGVYDPWTNEWQRVKATNGRVSLPAFSRSLVVRAAAPSAPA